MLDKLCELKEKIFERKVLFIGLLFFIVLIVSVFYYLLNLKDFESSDNSDSIVALKKDITEDKESCIVSVDVKGYVINEGLYKVECDSRVNDVIALAGGLKDNADTSVINLGKKVFDEMVIIVYSRDDVKNFTKVKQEEKVKEDKCINSATIKNDSCTTEQNRVETNISIVTDETIDNTPNVNNSSGVSINTAAKEELMTLTGIGESKALAIIEYRIKNGAFKSLEELMNIAGIGEKVFEKIKNDIKL